MGWHRPRRHPAEQRRCARRPYLLAGPDALATHIEGKIDQKRGQIGGSITELQLVDAAACFVAIACACGGIEQHTQDGLGGAGIPDRQLGEEQTIGDVITSQRLTDVRSVLIAVRAAELLAE